MYWYVGRPRVFSLCFCCSQRKSGHRQSIIIKRTFTKVRPNYFLAFRVNNSETYLNVKKVQEQFIAENPLYSKALINPQKLHITLDVFHLPELSDVLKVSSELEKWSKNRVSLPLEVKFKNIGKFSNGVLFANVVRCENFRELTAIVEELSELMTKSGYTPSNQKFTPHLTLLKLSRHRSLNKLKKDFNNIAKKWIEVPIDFGIQKVESIQLLSMTKTDSSGYYFCEKEVQI